MHFTTSSFCHHGGCVEVAIDKDAGEVHMRDSSGTVIVFTVDEWTTFIAGVKNGEFDF